MKIHFVKSGDTLEGLCRRYDVTEEVLRGANPVLQTFDSLKLTTGMKLKIPSKRTKLKVSNESTSQRKANGSVESSDLFKQQSNTATESGDLLKQQSESEMPIGSFHDMPKPQNIEPWGMPYPKMNAYFPVLGQVNPCGCQGSFNTMMPGNPSYPMPNAMPQGYIPPAPYPGIPFTINGNGVSPYSSYALPYAKPYQTPVSSNQNLQAVEDVVEDEEIEWLKKKRINKHPRRTAHKKKTNSTVAKIRKLSKSKSTNKNSINESLPWINL